jgi:hypothetical protein
VSLQTEKLVKYRVLCNQLLSCIPIGFVRHTLWLRLQKLWRVSRSYPKCLEANTDLKYTSKYHSNSSLTIILAFEVLQSEYVVRKNKNLQHSIATNSPVSIRCRCFFTFIILYQHIFKWASYRPFFSLSFCPFSEHFLPIPEGRVIAQAVSRWLPTAVAWVRARIWSCGICGGQNDAGAVFLRVLRSPLLVFIPPIAPQSPSSIIRGWYNRPIVAAVPSGLSLTPLITIIIIIPIPKPEILPDYTNLSPISSTYIF